MTVMHRVSNRYMRMTAIEQPITAVHNCGHTVTKYVVLKPSFLPATAKLVTALVCSFRMCLQMKPATRFVTESSSCKRQITC